MGKTYSHIKYTIDKPKALNKEKRDLEIISLFEDGLAQVKIADKLGVHRSTVRSVLVQNNIIK